MEGADVKGAKGGEPRDRSRVDLESSREVSYWCGELKCDEQALRAAVDRVGVMVDDVRRALVWGGTSNRVT